jgi:hypothetical protein
MGMLLTVPLPEILVHDGNRCLDGLSVRKERLYSYPYIAWHKPDSEDASLMRSLWNHRTFRETT